MLHVYYGNTAIVRSPVVFAACCFTRVALLYLLQHYIQLCLCVLYYPAHAYIQGPSHNPGVNQRALSELFKMVTQRQEDWDYSIVVSMLEIYNESVRDLLSVNSAEKLEIKQGPDGIFVPGLIQVQVSGFHDVNEVSMGTVSFQENE